MTVRLLPACSVPWVFLSMSATMRALPWEATAPPVLSSSLVVRPRSSIASMEPPWLLTRSATMETTLPRTPLGGVPAAVSVPLLSRLAAFKVSTLSAWIRPPRLSTAPVAVTVRSRAASVPSRLTMLAASMRASPAAAITPPVLFKAPPSLIAASPVDVSLPPWL